MPMTWLWIPVTLWAAFAQTVRNAAQRHLVSELGTLGATLVRFLYGLPFALLWLLVAMRVSGASLPGFVPSNTYPCADGKYVVIGANADSIFKRMMRAIDTNQTQLSEICEA